MLPFGITDTEFAVVTFMSAFVGISLVIWISRAVKVRYLAAFALGVYLWFFTDTLSGANYLDVNGGFVYSPYVVSLVALFIAGLAVFFVLDRRLFSSAGRPRAEHWRSARWPRWRWVCMVWPKGSPSALLQRRPAAAL